MKKEFIHELIESFQYSYNGQFEKAQILNIKAPKSNDFYGNLQFLDSLTTRAEMRTMKNIAGLLKELNLSDEDKRKAQENNNNIDENESALNSYNQLLGGLEREEIKQLDILIVELLKSSCMVDGEKNFEETFWQDMSIEDKRLIIGKYIENFTVSSQRNSKKV